MQEFDKLLVGGETLRPARVLRFSLRDVSDVYRMDT